MKVLIIEDDPSIATNLVDYLEGNSYDNDVASNDNAGLHLAQAEPWDAILLDLSLPGMDGLTLPQAARGGAPGHPGADAHRERPIGRQARRFCAWRRPLSGQAVLAPGSRRPARRTDQALPGRGRHSGTALR